MCLLAPLVAGGQLGAVGLVALSAAPLAGLQRLEQERLLAKRARLSRNKNSAG